MDLYDEIDKVSKEVISRIIDEKIRSGSILDIINTKMSEDARFTYLGMLEEEMPRIKHEIAMLAYSEFRNMILYDDEFLRSLSDSLFYCYNGMIRKELEEDYNKINELSGKSQEIESHLSYIDKISMCKIKPRIEDDEVL